MRLFCFPAGRFDLYESAPDWVFLATEAWELEVVAARDGRTIARWLAPCGRKVADVEVGRA